MPMTAALLRLVVVDKQPSNTRVAVLQYKIDANSL